MQYARTAAAPLAALVLGLVLLATGVAATLVLVVGVVERPHPLALPLFGLWLLAMALVVRLARRPGPFVPQADWPVLLGVVALAMLLRLWSANLASGVGLGADPMNYANLARAVLDGRGLVTSDWQYGEGLRAYFPPLYPLLLAGWWGLFGQSIAATVVLHTLVDAAAAAALASAGRRIGQARAGIAAGLAYFAWPAFALAAGVPQKEGLTVLLVVLMLRALAGWLQAPPDEARRWRHGLQLGLWWGLLALTQASLVLAPAAVALVLAWQRGIGPVVRLGLTAVPALLVVLAPWWLRNWLLFGAFVPFTTASGMMVNAAWRDARLPFPPGLFDLPEPQRGAVMGELARARILSEPVAFLREALHSMALGFAYEEASLARFRHTTPPISPADHAALAPLLQGAWAALLLSAAAGAVQRWRQRLADPVVLYALALLGAVVAVNLWFEFGERHRLLLTPFLLLLAAGCWLGAGRRGR